MKVFRQNPPNKKTDAKTTSSDNTKIEVQGSLDPSEYIGSQPANPETIKAVVDYLKQQEESAKTKALIRLTNTIECSLVVSFLLIGFTVLNPGSDKTVAKELLSQTIASQVILLRTVLNCFKTTKK